MTVRVPSKELEVLSEDHTVISCEGELRSVQHSASWRDC